ncbi:MAG: mechanosensitive ion channel family protein [Myxococcales bacterium]|nr:mechanosensitive ion channel family protein [Myxococcales bacterium]
MIHGSLAQSLFPEALAQAFAGLLLKLQDWLETLVVMVPNLLLALLAVVVAGYSARYVGRLVRAGLQRAIANEALANLAGAVTRVAVVIAGLSVALSLLHLEKTVTSLLAGVGVVGLALGFAFQDIAANFMSGAMLAVRGPFAPGDIVEINDKIGRVEVLELRRTVLRTVDGLNVIVPNKEIFQATITNYTRTDERRIDLELGVAYGDDLLEAQEVVREALADFEGRLESRDVEVFFTEFGSSSINFVVQMWLPSSEQLTYLRARSQMIVCIKQAIDDAGLTIPFPIRTLDFGADAVGGRRLEIAQAQADVA